MACRSHWACAAVPTPLTATDTGSSSLSTVAVVSSSICARRATLKLLPTRRLLPARAACVPATRRFAALFAAASDQERGEAAVPTVPSGQPPGGAAFSSDSGIDSLSSQLQSSVEAAQALAAEVSALSQKAGYPTTPSVVLPTSTSSSAQGVSFSTPGLYPPLRGGVNPQQTAAQTQLVAAQAELARQEAELRHLEARLHAAKSRSGGSNTDSDDVHSDGLRMSSYTSSGSGSSTVLGALAKDNTSFLEAAAQAVVTSASASASPDTSVHVAAVAPVLARLDPVLATEASAIAHKAFAQAMAAAAALDAQRAYASAAQATAQMAALKSSNSGAVGIDFDANSESARQIAATQAEVDALRAEAEVLSALKRAAEAQAAMSVTAAEEALLAVTGTPKEEEVVSEEELARRAAAAAALLDEMQRAEATRAAAAQSAAAQRAQEEKEIAARRAAAAAAQAAYAAEREAQLASELAARQAALESALASVQAPPSAPVTPISDDDASDGTMALEPGWRVAWEAAAATCEQRAHVHSAVSSAILAALAAAPSWATEEDVFNEADIAQLRATAHTMTPKAAWVAAWAVAATRTIRKADAIAQRLAAEKAAAEAQAADMAAAEQRAAAMAAEEAAAVARRAAALRAQASYRAAALSELQRKQEEARVTAQMDMTLDVQPTEAVSGTSSTSVLSSTMRYGALAALAAGIVIASRFLGAAGGSSSWASRTAGAQTAASVALVEGVPNLYVRETTIGKAARR